MQKYVVMKKENEDGPEVKGGHMDALIILATKVEKISENGKPLDKRDVWCFLPHFWSLCASERVGKNGRAEGDSV